MKLAKFFNYNFNDNDNDDFELYDKNGNEIYFENSYGFWGRYEYDNSVVIYFEDSHNGILIDNRPKLCDGKIVEIDGKKYQLKEI